MPQSALPSWIHKRDGRLVPFEPDRIARSLFAGTEALGRPDPFTARELSESVLFFLASEANGATPTTAQVEELMIKVVREFGHPELARAIADHTVQNQTEGNSKVSSRSSHFAHEVDQFIEQGGAPLHLAREAGAVLLRDYALCEVFSRDLTAAQEEGLITLLGLDAPLEMAAYVLPLRNAQGLLDALEDARRLVGGHIALDGPEYLLSTRPQSEQGLALAHFVHDLALGLRLTGLGSVVNLNTASPPTYAGDLADGPLFAEQRPHDVPDHRTDLCLQLLELLLSRHTEGQGGAAARIDWHLGEQDCSPARKVQLASLARRALEVAPLAFVFDRPRRPLPLGEGLDRRHPAILLSVGLHLPRLIRQPGVNRDPALFLHKLGSLAGFALSAANQKRAFLRRRPAHWPGFLLDRARLVVIPVGLEEAVRELQGWGLCQSEAALAFAKQVIQRLAEVLGKGGRAIGIDATLDSVYFSRSPAVSESPPSPQEELSKGLTPWDPAAAPKDQLKAAGILHAITGTGTATLLFQEEESPPAEHLADLLRHAWRHTDIVRLRVHCLGRRQQQLQAPWEDSSFS